MYSLLLSCRGGGRNAFALFSSAPERCREITAFPGARAYERSSCRRAYDACAIRNVTRGGRQIGKEIGFVKLIVREAVLLIGKEVDFILTLIVWVSIPQEC